MLLLRCSLRATALNANVLRQVWNTFCPWGQADLRHGMNLKFELTPLEVKKVKRGSERELFSLWVTGATRLVIKHRELELVIYEYIFDLSAVKPKSFMWLNCTKWFWWPGELQLDKNKRAAHNWAQAVLPRQHCGTQLMGTRDNKQVRYYLVSVKTGKSHQKLRTSAPPSPVCTRELPGRLPSGRQLLQDSL